MTVLLFYSFFFSYDFALFFILYFTISCFYKICADKYTKARSGSRPLPAPSKTAWVALGSYAYKSVYYFIVAYRIFNIQILYTSFLRYD